MQLRYPVHFCCPKAALWPELRSWSGTQLSDQVLSDRSGGILHSWVLRTYYQLRIAGEAVTISDGLRRDAINIVSVRDFGRKQRDLASFIVVPQGDAHHSQLANFRILQNGLRPLNGNAAVIWHWPQPGIIARDPYRESRVARLCYKGRLLNLDESFRSESFIAELKVRGVFFEIDAYSGLRGDHKWNDYFNADAVLAVRNLTLYDAIKKPASKLVNAWFADLPAILGPEPAYRELGEAGQDYLEVKSPRDALEAVTTLQNNPSLFHKIVENGRKKRENYTECSLTKLWIETLNGPISEMFSQWLKTSLWKRAVYATNGILHENRARRQDVVTLKNGARLLDDVPVPSEREAVN